MTKRHLVVNTQLLEVEVVCIGVHYSLYIRNEA